MTDIKDAHLGEVAAAHLLQHRGTIKLCWHPDGWSISSTDFEGALIGSFFSVDLGDLPEFAEAFLATQLTPPAGSEPSATLPHEAPAEPSQQPHTDAAPESPPAEAAAPAEATPEQPDPQ